MQYHQIIHAKQKEQANTNFDHKPEQLIGIHQISKNDEKCKHRKGKHPAHR